MLIIVNNLENIFPAAVALLKDSSIRQELWTILGVVSQFIIPFAILLLNKDDKNDNEGKKKKKSMQ